MILFPTLQPTLLMALLLLRVPRRAVPLLFALSTASFHLCAEPSIPLPVPVSTVQESAPRAVQLTSQLSQLSPLSPQPAAQRYGPSAAGKASLHSTEAGERLIALPAWLFSDWLQAIVLGTVLSLSIGLRTYWLRRRRAQHEMRIAVRMGERNRIARELHDSLLQSFHGLMFRLQAARNVLPNSPAEAAEMIDGTLTRGDHAMNEARRAIQQLRGIAGAESDLVQSVAALAQDLQLRGADVCLPAFRVVESGEARGFDQLIHDDIYCIVREAVRNAFHHAQARHIDVEIHYTGPSFLIYVRDDGVGMSAEVLGQKRRVGHWGIQGMKERAASFGGGVAIVSTPGEGTTVSLMVPGKLFTAISSDEGPWLARFRSNFLAYAARSAP